MTRSMQYRIWFRTLRFVAVQWVIPFCLGLLVAYLFLVASLSQIDGYIIEACGL